MRIGNATRTRVARVIEAEESYEGFMIAMEIIGGQG